MRETLPARELRLAVVPVQFVTVRDATATGDGSWTISGYAAVFNQETTLFEIPGWYRMREEIAPGAFARVLERVAAGEELVHLNYVHEMASAVAATDVEGIGGLELGEDYHGLHFFARVDPTDPDAQRMAAKMRRGIVKQASFAFTIADEERVSREEMEDGTLDEKWRILEVGHLYDVCVCPQGAYPQTESNLRSLAAASLGRAGIDPAGRDRRSPEGVSLDAPKQAKGRKLELARARAWAAVLTDKHR
jgi:HK97 family phage prohead protease